MGFIYLYWSQKASRYVHVCFWVDASRYSLQRNCPLFLHNNTIPHDMSHAVKTPAFYIYTYICENKGAFKYAADQCLGFAT